MSSPKAKRKQRTPLQRVIRWGPWHYRFWREIARWCYEQSLHNPAVVPADDGFPAHRQLLESYQQIRQETLEVALSGRLPANHDIMQQQRTLYEFDRKIWGMLPLRGYGYNYPANQALIPSLRSFLKHHPDVVSAAVSLFPPREGSTAPQRSVQRGMEVSPAVVRGGFWQRPQFLRTDD